MYIWCLYDNVYFLWCEIKPLELLLIFAIVHSSGRVLFPNVVWIWHNYLYHLHVNEYFQFVFDAAVALKSSLYIMLKSGKMTLFLFCSHQ